MLFVFFTAYKEPTSSNVVTQLLPELADGFGDVEDLPTHKTVWQLHKEQTVLPHHKRKVLHHHHHQRDINYTV